MNKHNQRRSLLAAETTVSTVRSRPCGGSSEAFTKRNESQRIMRTPFFEVGHRCLISMVLLMIVSGSSASVLGVPGASELVSKRLEIPSEFSAPPPIIQQLRGSRQRDLQGDDEIDGELVDEFLEGLGDDKLELSVDDDEDESGGEGLLDFVKDIVDMFEDPASNSTTGGNNATTGEVFVEVMDKVIDIIKDKDDDVHPEGNEVELLDKKSPGLGDEEVQGFPDETLDEPHAPVLATAPPVEPTKHTEAPVSSPVAPPVASPVATLQPSDQQGSFDEKKDGSTEGEDDIFDESYYNKNARPETAPTTFSVVATLLGISAMIMTAWQMSDNPDGIFASMCRLIITCLQLVFRVTTSPCRKCMPCCFSHHAGNGYHEPYGHMRVSTMDYGYKDPALELS